jgi:hypothetical protein
MPSLFTKAQDALGAIRRFENCVYDEGLTTAGKKGIHQLAELPLCPMPPIAARFTLPYLSIPENKALQAKLRAEGFQRSSLRW